MNEDEFTKAPHYNALNALHAGCGKPIECWDVVEVLGYNLGNAVKYIWRADFKGNKADDLKKSIAYLQRELAKVENAR